MFVYEILKKILIFRGFLLKYIKISVRACTIHEQCSDTNNSYSMFWGSLLVKSKIHKKHPTPLHMRKLEKAIHFLVSFSALPPFWQNHQTISKICWRKNMRSADIPNKILQIILKFVITPLVPKIGSEKYSFFKFSHV